MIKMIFNFYTKVWLAHRLGIINTLRVIWYKLSLKLTFGSAFSPALPLKTGDFFSPYQGQSKSLPCNENWRDNHIYFSYLTLNCDTPPDWHKNILTGTNIANKSVPWYQISDFSAAQGDIKGIWEASRFDWVIAIAQQSCQTLDNTNKLNTWLNSWVKHNPVNSGANWKCAQECSFRVMHLAMAAIILEQFNQTNEPLLRFIKAHLNRISGTLSYALAQDNNHGTSEAAALFIGGSWLANHGDIQGKEWQKLGEKQLIERAKYLIEDDGSFSQYSATYHRVMLDTYSMAEVWRRHLNLTPFHESLYNKLNLAASWLYWFTQPTTGNAPNLGSNDGARLLPLTDTDYRDFRPSVQLACCLFIGKYAYSNPPSADLPLRWLNINKPDEQLENAKNKDFPSGGYGILINATAFAMLNYPIYKFRPHQCDALHVDFWLNGENLLRDGGTYSYNDPLNRANYFTGVKSHNTVEFDSHEQMPRYSKFLLSHWLKTTNKVPLHFDGNRSHIGAGYVDHFGCQHKRKLSLSSNNLVIKDSLSHFKHNAIIRWRLKPGNWAIKGNEIFDDFHCISVQSNVKIKRIELIDGYESLYYYQENKIPVVEIEIESPGVVTTKYNYKK